MKTYKPTYSIKISRILVILLIGLGLGVHFINQTTNSILSSFHNENFQSLESSYKIESITNKISLSIEHTVFTNSPFDYNIYKKQKQQIDDLHSTLIKHSQSMELNYPLDKLEQTLQTLDEAITSLEQDPQSLTKYDWDKKIIPNLEQLPAQMTHFRTQLANYRQKELNFHTIFKVYAILGTILLLATIFFVRHTLIKDIQQNISITHEVSTELEDQRIQTEATARLASIGEMAGGIAHEINNPLAIIKGYSEIINMHCAKGTVSAETVKPLIQNILKTVDRISKIITGLRKISRRSDNDPFILSSVAEVIDEALDLCMEKLKSKGFQFKLSIEANPSIMCNPVEISQVLINLVNNAYDATAHIDHSWIEIKTEISSDDTRVVISVTDCGLGIPEELQGKIFQPYFTTKESGKGTGLGLSISKSIIEKHGGLFEYDSSAKNTRFLLTFPTATKEYNTKLKKVA